jgi:hypothetical protein
MKTFLLDIIPKIQRFSQNLDNVTWLTNKHWVVVNEETDRKVVFIFREKDSQLLISENGIIEKGTWEYLGNNSLLIDRKDGSYLFKHGFIDDTVLALKVDGKNEYALLVNEHKYDNKLNSLPTIIQFLNETYSSERQKRILTIPQTIGIANNDYKPQIKIKPATNFNSSDYPNLDEDIDAIKSAAPSANYNLIADILISFCRDHSIKAEFIIENPDFTKKVVSKELPIELIEQLFKLNSDNKIFISELETFIKCKIYES